jgi:hypothetical protein
MARSRGALRAAVVAGALLASGLLATALFPTRPPAVARTSDGDEPRFTDDGAMLRPRDYERWILVGASLGLGYRPGGGGGHPQLFHAVYLEPGAYDHVQRTGAFPDGTVLVLELRRAAAGAPPAAGGTYQGELVAVEAAVKDPARYAEGWAYFDFGAERERAEPQPAERCFACHDEHAATDNVFTQFYPWLRSSD